jgi:prefoldin subunit 5
MKKIFRMALVFALAGATLMYTGCTKDYGEEIDNLDGKLSALQTDLTNKVNDLSNEVSSLRSAVSGLESAYKAADDLIKGDVTALDGRVKKLEDAVKDLSKYATKDELKEATDALEKKIADAKEDIKKTTDDLQKQINELKEKLAANEEAVKKLEAAQKEVDAVYGFLSDELRSIVFYPDFYFAGIEATSYDFASFYGYEAYYATNAMGQPITVKVQDEPKIEFAKKALIYRTWLIYVDANGNYLWKFDDEGNIVLKDGKPVADKNGSVWYFMDHLDGQIGKAYYDLNPSSFPTDSATWSLNGDNKRYVVKSEEEDATWKPVFESITPNVNGHAEVLYSVENPELIWASVINAFPMDVEELKPEVDDEALEARLAAAEQEMEASTNVPIMQLVGTLSDEREIVSDWHAVASGEEFVSHLVFGKKNFYKTVNSCELTGSGLPKVLYANGTSAALNDPSVPIKYNGGPFNLAEIISIHTTPRTTAEAQEYTLAEFTEKYPGYSYRFTEVPYTIGENKTSEDQYCVLDGDNLIPCYVKSDGSSYESIPIEKDSEDGISAVGRMPIILVELVDADGYAYIAQWFKVIISKDAKEPQVRTFEIPGLDKVPFVCTNFKLATTWDEFSYFVLENLKMDYEEFIKTYTFTGIWGMKGVLSEDGKSVVTKLDELVPAKADQKVAVNFTNYYMKNGAPATQTKKYGEAIYKMDKSGSGINDAFEWEVSPQGIGEGKSNTIYFRFENGEYDIVYFAMTADVAKKPGLTFVGNKLLNEWFNDITDDIDINTARMNVPVPTADKTSPVIGGDVKLFQRDINHYFQGYKPQLALDDASKDVYGKFFDGDKPSAGAYPDSLLYTTTKFQFSDKQPAIAGIQLFTNYWEDSMVLAAYHYDYSFGFPRLVTQKVTYKGQEIEVPAVIDTVATIKVDGKDEKTGLDIYLLKYYDGDVAKQLLNLWSYTETDEAKMLYANILAKNTYGSCNIGLPDGNFHVRFIRPLDVNFSAQDVAEESAVDGNNVELAKFISGIIDWNKQSVIVKEMVAKDPKKPNDLTWTGYYIENVIKTVNMYKYYQFSKLRINLGKVERNNWNPANPNEWASLADKTPGAKLQLGTVDLTVDEKDRVFTPTTLTPTTDAQGNIIYEMDITDFADLKGAVLNYRNDEAFIGSFTMRIPVELDYAWGTLTAYLVINVKDTGSTTPTSL